MRERPFAISMMLLLLPLASSCGFRIGTGIDTGPLGLYPPFERDLIMWPDGDFREPALPRNANTIITVDSTESFQQALSQSHCSIRIFSGSVLYEASIPNSSTDIEIFIESGASIRFMFIHNGSKSQRVRFRGPGKIGAISLLNASDVVFDGVVFDPVGLGVPEGCISIEESSRVAILNCVGRSNDGDNCCFWINGLVSDFLMANCNFAVDSAPDSNKWVVRLNNDRHDPVMAMRRLLFVDSTMQTYNQAFRFSSDGVDASYFDKVMLYRCKLVNVENGGNVIHSQDQAPVDTNHVYLRDCVTVMAGGEAWAFGGNPSTHALDDRANDWLWHVVDHTYVADAETTIDASMLRGIMAGGAALGWDLQYLGTASRPMRLDGAVFLYDPGISSLWRDNDYSTPSWPEIRSPLVGDDVIIGRNPHIIP